MLSQFRWAVYCPPEGRQSVEAAELSQLGHFTRLQGRDSIVDACPRAMRISSGRNGIQASDDNGMADDTAQAIIATLGLQPAAREP